MKKSPSVLILTLILGGLSIILAVSVYALNSITAPIVEEGAREAEKAAFIEIMPEATDFIDVRDKAGDDPAILEVFEVKKNSDTIGFLYVVSTVGYADAIENLVAIDVTTDTIRSIKVLKQAETPGLGSNVTEASFQEQFQGLALSDITVVKNGADKDSNEIDAITASTITSKAVVKGINIVIEDYLANFSERR